MREDVYKAAMAFLNRVDLKGSEVQAFDAVKQAITECYQNTQAQKEPQEQSKDNAEES